MASPEPLDKLGEQMASAARVFLRQILNSLIGPSRVHKVAELMYRRFDYVKENMAGRRMLRDVLEVKQGDADALKVRAEGAFTLHETSELPAYALFRRFSCQVAGPEVSDITGLPGCQVRSPGLVWEEPR